jgi:hypothetical protein
MKLLKVSHKTLDRSNFPPTEINIMAMLALISLKIYLIVVHYISVAHLPMLNKPATEHFICYVVNNKLNNGYPVEFQSNTECGTNPRAPY